MVDEALQARVLMAEETLTVGRSADAMQEFDLVAGLLDPSCADAIRLRVVLGQLSSRGRLAAKGATETGAEAVESAALTLAEAPGLDAGWRERLFAAIAFSALMRGEEERSLRVSTRRLELLMVDGESGRTIRARLAVAQASFELGLFEEAKAQFSTIVRLLDAAPELVRGANVAARYTALAQLRISQALTARGEVHEARVAAGAGLAALRADDPKNAKLRGELVAMLKEADSEAARPSGASTAQSAGPPDTCQPPGNEDASGEG